MAASKRHPILQKRRAGVLCHVSSLPSGDIGDDAFQFVDCLKNMAVTVWQTLPLTMPHGDGSPYQSLSSHAGNPAFISLKSLVDDGWLPAQSLQNPREVCLQTAHKHFMLLANPQQLKAFESFCEQQQHWLHDFALFCVLREHFSLASWSQWPQAFKTRDKMTIKRCEDYFATAISCVKFVQFVFFQQWAALKKYANKQGVYLFGDIPIFVAYDSADVWAHPELFKLDSEGQMTVVAGVPPDYFSATGQRWGNPHYEWSAMKKTKFRWWIERLATQNAMFDILRIDHFRGLEAAWEIPASEPTAINGAWQVAPGADLLKALQKSLPDLALVAEDLGIITEEVDALRMQFNLPGMKILQFAFGGDENNPYLPEQIDASSVAYTGTHDNDTSLGWYQHLDERAKSHFHQYIEDVNPDMPDALVALTLATEACLAIVPMQDILALDSTCRMNIPGTIEGNWKWRFSWHQLNHAYKHRMKTLVVQAKRK